MSAARDSAPLGLNLGARMFSAAWHLVVGASIGNDSTEAGEAPFPRSMWLATSAIGFGGQMDFDKQARM